jgi:hypothetical protein
MSSTSIIGIKPKTHVTLTQKMQARCSGMKATFANITQPVFANGKSIQPAAFLAQGESFLAELKDVDSARSVLKDKLAVVKKDKPVMTQYLTDSEEVMRQVLGRSNPALASMDIKPESPPKARKPSPARVVKSAQIRQNRETMKVQNKAVLQSKGQAVVDLSTGDVVSILPPANGDSATPASTSASSPPPASSAAPAVATPEVKS